MILPNEFKTISLLEFAKDIEPDQDTAKCGFPDCHECVHPSKFLCPNENKNKKEKI